MYTIMTNFNNDLIALYRIMVITSLLILHCSQILNPLDAICDRKRADAICVSNLKNAKKVDKSVLVERPDVKIFLPFRFYVYDPKTLFIPNTYNRFLGTLTIM